MNETAKSMKGIIYQLAITILLCQILNLRHLSCSQIFAHLICSNNLINHLLIILFILLTSDSIILYMQARKKSDFFKNQIRRKHQSRIITQMREVLHQRYQLQTQLQHTKWIQYLHHPGSIIPTSVLHPHFHHIFHIKQPILVKKLQDIVNKILDGGRLVNVIFVTCLIETYNTSGCWREFFKKVIQHPYQQFEFSEVKNYTKFNNSEQILLNFYVKYLNNLRERESLQLLEITAIKNLFVKYWDQSIQKCGEINYQLSALLTQRFIQFKKHLKGLDNIINGVISVLVQNDSSLETYNLVRSAILCDVNTGMLTIMHHKFTFFLQKGLEQKTLKVTLKILEAILIRNQFFEVSQINYKTITQILIKRYLEINEKKGEQYILNCLFNICFSEIEEVYEVFLSLDYEKLFLKTATPNLYPFLDFCVAALFCFPREQLFRNISERSQFRLLLIISQYVINESGQKVWQLIVNLVQALQIYLQTNEYHGGIAEGLQRIVQRLESVAWKENKLGIKNDGKLGEKLEEWEIKKNQQKEELLNKIQGLIKKC